MFLLAYPFLTDHVESVERAKDAHVGRELGICTSNAKMTQEVGFLHLIFSLLNLHGFSTTQACQVIISY